MKFYYKIIIQVLFLALLVLVTFWLTSFVKDNGYVQEMVRILGYPSILIISLVGALNIAFPIPVILLSVPIFLTAGYSLISIIIGIIIGTTIGDLLSFYIGTLGKPIVDRSNNYVIKFFRACCTGRRKLASLFVFLYASLIPLPNELILIPLGALGFKLKDLFIPFVVGTAINTTIIAYGIAKAFEFFS